MRFSIWLTTSLANWACLGLILTFVLAPPPPPLLGPLIFGLFLAFFVAQLFLLRCPVCRVFTSSWWMGGGTWFGLYFSNPVVFPGRCGRCRLSFHSHSFGDDLSAERQRWRRDHP